jgi:hypothetical protein
MANTSNPAHAAQDAKNKAQGAASSAMEAVKGAASATMEKAREIGSAVGQRAEDAVTGLGTGVRSMGNAIESGGRYLEERDFRGMAEDFANLVRRNPIPSLLIGVGLGYLLSLAFRR